jgi:hypothetical protein
MPVWFVVRRFSQLNQCVVAAFSQRSVRRNAGIRLLTNERGLKPATTCLS